MTERTNLDDLARKNAELQGEIERLRARFRDLTEGSEDHIWEVDGEGCYTYNSPSVRCVLQREPEEMLGRHYADFIHAEDRDEMNAFLAELHRERKPLRGMIQRVINGQGDVVYVESRAFPIFGEDGEVTGYRGVDRNISDWFESRNILEETLVGTCEALSRMVELRDPYTRGHSVRVSELSVMIGEEMGCSAHDLQGLKLMGLLHDLGKIGIPTGILSKPGRLSSAELNLLRQHPAMGYEILRGISFTWPVATVVHQHHERLDGSGYPQGLMSDEIIWQVRLMAVADLLEAMAIDRPYRTGLGLDRAIDELESGSGLVFDDGIVAAVLRLKASGRLDAYFDSQSPERDDLPQPANELC